MIVKKELDSSKIERDIIAQMIVNTEFLHKISQIYESNSLKMPYVNTLADLCVDYFKEHEKAPGKHIQDLYDGIVRIDPDQKELIKTFLVSINEMIQNYDPDKLYNTDFHFKLTIDHLTHLRISRVLADAENLIAAKEYEQIEALFKNFQSPKHEYSPAKDAMTDKDFVQESFAAEEGSILFTVPGPLGELMGPIRKGGYYLVSADTGVGKSWILDQIAVAGAYAGVSTGLLALEMTKEQTNVRIQHILSGECLYKEVNDELFVPIWDCYYNLTGECARGYDAIATSVSVIEKNGNKSEQKTKFVIPSARQFDQYSRHEVCVKCMGKPPITNSLGFKPSTWYKKIKAEYIDAYKAMNNIDIRMESAGNFAPIFIDAFDRNSLSVKAYDAWLHNLYHYEDKYIQMGVLDYADEMKLEGNDERLGINAIHGGLKAISQARCMANVTASQENDEGKLFGSRKKGHLIDGGIRVMQTPEEKVRGIYRFESIKQRFGKGTKGQILYTTSCLEIGKPILDSHWDVKY